MIEFSFRISDGKCIHTRPASELSKLLSVFSSDVTIEHKNQVADGKNLMSLMSLNLRGGDVIKIQINGTDEIKVQHQCEYFLLNNF